MWRCKRTQAGGRSRPHGMPAKHDLIRPCGRRDSTIGAVDRALTLLLIVGCTCDVLFVGFSPMRRHIPARSECTETHRASWSTDQFCHARVNSHGSVYYSLSVYVVIDFYGAFRRYRPLDTVFTSPEPAVAFRQTSVSLHPAIVLGVSSLIKFL